MLENCKTYQIYSWYQELLQALNHKLYECKKCAAAIGTWRLSDHHCKHLKKSLYKFPAISNNTFRNHLLISCNQEAYLTTSPISEGWECVFRDSERQRATAGKLQCDWRWEKLTESRTLSNKTLYIS